MSDTPEEDYIHKIQQEKSQFRNALIDTGATLSLHPQKWGKVAEQMRRLSSYKDANEVFVSPASELTQVRINSLVDGKELIMPGPGLKNGFFLLKPYTVPFRDLAYAVSFKGLHKFGKLLSQKELHELNISIFIVDALAINKQGDRLGEGLGFFDLSLAIFSEIGGAALDHKVFAIVDREQIVQERVPTCPWDVKIDGIITAEDFFQVDGERDPAPPEIYWQYLTQKKIKKITPLWKMWKKKD